MDSSPTISSIFTISNVKYTRYPVQHAYKTTEDWWLECSPMTKCNDNKNPNIYRGEPNWQPNIFLLWPSQVDSHDRLLSLEKMCGIVVFKLFSTNLRTLIHLSEEYSYLPLETHACRSKLFISTYRICFAKESLWFVWKAVKQMVIAGSPYDIDVLVISVYSFLKTTEMD